MAETSTPLPKIRSYQNCSNKDVIGYNDCPDYLFKMIPSSGKSKQKRIQLGHVATTDGVNHSFVANSAPPRAMRRFSSKSNASSIPSPDSTPLSSSIESFEGPNYTSLPLSPSTSVMSAPIALNKCMNAIELKARIEDIYNSPNKLQDKEFAFYKNKLQNNLMSCLDQDNTRMVLTIFFNESTDKNKAQSILEKWMYIDMSVGEWSPYLLKIYRNTVV